MSVYARVKVTIAQGIKSFLSHILHPDLYIFNEAYSTEVTLEPVEMGTPKSKSTWYFAEFRRRTNDDGFKPGEEYFTYSKRPSATYKASRVSLAVLKQQRRPTYWI